jgi:hypothetical protein
MTNRVEVPFIRIIKRNDPTFFADRVQQDEYEFRGRTFRADPTTRGAYGGDPAPTDIFSETTPDLESVDNLFTETREFVPTNIPGLLVWFDAADTSSITRSSGASVAKWNDKSGNDRHAVQAIVARQPTLETAAQNGYNLIAFTNTTAGSESILSFPRLYLGGACTLAAVVRMGVLPGSPVVNVFGDSVNAWEWLFEWWTDTKVYSLGLLTNSWTNAEYPLVGCHTIIIPTGRILFDGVGEDPPNTDHAGISSGYIDTIGNGDSGTYSQGEMAEILAFNRVLNPTEIEQLQSYLKAKWATP